MEYRRMMLPDKSGMGSQRKKINRTLMTTCLWDLLPNRFTSEKSAR